MPVMLNADDIAQNALALRLHFANKGALQICEMPSPAVLLDLDARLQARVHIF